MSDSERVFVSYVIPARSLAAVSMLLHASLVTVASFVIAWHLIAPSYPDFPVTGGIALTFAIVAAVVAIALLFKYISNRDEQIRVTDRAITSNSKTWTWEQVLQVDLHHRSRHVFIHVNNGPARSRLTLLIQVPGNESKVVMSELRSFVEARGISIRDRGPLP